MVVPAGRLVAALGVLAWLAGSASAQAPGTWDWSGYGCFTVGVDSVVIEPCTFDGSAAAGADAPVAGTLSYDLAWTLQTGSGLVGGAQIWAGGEVIHSVGTSSTSGWCGAPPCSSGATGFSVHLAQGQSFAVALQFYGDFTGLTFSLLNMQFTPDVGFLGLGGALDGGLVLTLEGLDDVQALAGLGDVDGDGVPDFVLGRPFESSVATNAGEIQVRSGASGALIHDIFAQNAFDYVGFAADSVGDMDGDGVDDFLHDAVQGSGPGKLSNITVRSGASGVLLYALELGSPVGGSSKAAVGAGDVDLDGVPDVAIGMPTDDTAGVDAGLVRIRSGATGAVVQTALGPSAGQRFGQFLAEAGDMDGDGVPDLLAGGTPEQAFNPQSLPNKAFAVSGATGLVLHTWSGAALGSEIGEVLDGAGDVNGDGRADAIVGLPGEERVRVFSGLDGTQLYETSGAPADQHGRSVAGLGDLDGDGLGDIAVGAPGVSIKDGAVRVYATPAGLLLYVVEPYPADFGPNGPNLGERVAAGGDVTGDGLRDLLVVSDPDSTLFSVSGAPADHRAPLLAGAGTLVGGTPMSLSLQDGPPGGSAVLVVGLGQLLQPLKGGLMVPTLDLVLPGLPLDPSGALRLHATWPVGVPSGLPLFAQVWCPSPSTPGPLVASNALQLVTP